jgi:hypothetical protein
MSVRITLSDSHMPPSEQFIEFLDTWLASLEFDGSSWAKHRFERPPAIGAYAAPDGALARVADSEVGIRHLARAYELFAALLVGEIDAIRQLQEQFRFILVVGAPRSGGKYLTKELFRALGHDPLRVPAVLAHDGFPEAGPWRFDRLGNGWIESLHTMAEYLVMVELFFQSSSRQGPQVSVPKKATKAVYAPGLFQDILGGECIITVRHPVPSCISTYETAGGLAADHRFTQRNNIEILWARDLLSAGLSQAEIEDMDYFDAYLRYWEDYHVRLAMSGLASSRRCRVVAYGEQRFTDEARRIANRFGAPTSEVEQFHVSDRRDLHPDWVARAEPALGRTDEQWTRVGLKFPLAEIAECW